MSRLSLAPFTQHCGFPPHIKSILYGFLSKLGELEGFKPFQLRTLRKKETDASVFVSMWYIQSAAAFLRVSCELTTTHHSVCGRVTQRWREIVVEGAVDVKHNRYDIHECAHACGHQHSCSWPNVSERHTLSWHHSSQSWGFNGRDKLKEQLNYDAWIPRRLKKKTFPPFFLPLSCLDISSPHKVDSCLQSTWKA